MNLGELKKTDVGRSPEAVKRAVQKELISLEVHRKKLMDLLAFRNLRAETAVEAMTESVANCHQAVAWLVEEGYLVQK